MFLQLAIVVLLWCGVTGGAVAQTAANDNLSVNARFLVAARNADAAGLERALAAGASVNSRNRLGETALVILLKNNQVDLAQKMLAADADVNLAAVNGSHAADGRGVQRPDRDGEAAAGQGRECRRRRPSAEERNDLRGRRRPHRRRAAAAGGKGIDPNAVYNNDLTALMWAAGFGKTETVKVLLAAGANPKVKDNRGKTAADMARDEHFDETAALIDAAR